MTINHYKEMFADTSHLQPGSKAYKRGSCIIILSPPHGQCGWHMSISTSYRDPTWKEIRDAWYDLVPDAETKNGAMFFPPKEEYVDVQKYCFHVHEMPLMAKQWSVEK